MGKTAWEILDEIATSKPGRHFRVQCPSCKRCRILSTSVINSGRSNCVCDRENKFDPFLTVVIADEPVRKRLSQWIDEYPEVNMNAVKTRFYSRNREGYTEAQILFGVKGFNPDPVKRKEAVAYSSMDKAVQETSDALADAVSDTVKRFFKAGKAGVIMDTAKTALRFNMDFEPPTPDFVGGAYVTDIGVSLRDLVESGDYRDAVEILKLDRYQDVTHKFDRLSQFIDVDLSTPIELTRIEITQLFSLHRCMPDDE